jgi:type I restriction enzyme S subunit
MAGEFAETTLGRLMSFANGRSSPERADGLQYPVYGSNGVIGWAAEANADAGSIVIGRVGSYCGSLYFSKQRCWVTDNAIRATALDGNDSRFLFYLLSTLGLNNWRAGSGQPLLNQDILSRIPAAVPEPIEQRAIAHILGTLDDKIELNRRMSETLEAMARALFKSWFVDFDPVRAKAEGRDPGLPKPLADIFPDSFEDSELGEIPKGWRVGRLDDVLAELVSGARPKGGAVEEGVPSVGAENVIGLGKYDFSKEKYVPRDFFEDLKRKGSAVRPRDVLLYKDGAQIGRKTYFDCGFPHHECGINEHVFILRANRAQEQRYLFFWLDQDWMTQEIISLNSNSAQPGINQQGVRNLPLLIAPDPVVEAFDHTSQTLTDRLFASCIESRTLAALRDALLPKLISGELRVKDAEKFITEAR